MIENFIAWIKYILGLEEKTVAPIVYKQETVLESAIRCAQQDLEIDPSVTMILHSPHDSIIRLIQVTPAVLTEKGLESMWYFTFRPHKNRSVHYETQLILLSSEEWQNYQNGQLRLPADWNENLTQLF